MKLITTILLSFWSIQSHAMIFIHAPGSYSQETARGTIIIIGALVLIILFIMLAFKLYESYKLDIIRKELVARDEKTPW